MSSLEPPENAGFSISDLASAAGIEPRTIRSYVEKGIIPGPESLGRGARYPQDALDRLRVFQLLRDANRSLTLDQIRMLLQRLGRSELRGLADGRLRIDEVLDLDAGGEPSRTAAMDYIASFRNVAQPASRGTPAAADDRLPVLEEAARALVRLAGLPASSRAVRGEQWYRLPLTPDIELSVRGTFGSDQLAQLHRIGDALRLLLTKGPRP